MPAVNSRGRDCSARGVVYTVRRRTGHKGAVGDLLSQRLLSLQREE